MTPAEADRGTRARRCETGQSSASPPGRLDASRGGGDTHRDTTGPVVPGKDERHEMKVKPGQDATLHCRAPTDAVIALVEWTRPDLTPESHLYLYRDERWYEKYQHPSFRGRVELKDPEMKDGDVSLLLRNANINDTGTYECRILIPNTEHGEQKYSEIRHLNILAVTGLTAGHIRGGGNNDGHHGVVVVACVGGFLLVGVAVYVVHAIGGRRWFKGRERYTPTETT